MGIYIPLNTRPKCNHHKQFGNRYSRMDFKTVVIKLNSKKDEEIIEGRMNDLGLTW